jgi:glycosyltransferase involved in cell wall biosynthesis
MPEVCFPLLISKKLRGKSLVTIHDAIIYKIKERKWLSEKYIKFMYQLAKRAKIIHSPSYQSRKDLIKVLCIPKEKIFVIPWGIDLKRFRPLRRRRDEFTVGYLGGLGRRKNVDTVLRVAKTLERENIKFKIGGTGPQLNKLIKIKEKLKLKNVEFLGFIEEEKLPEFYNSLDVFLFPSSYEGFGIPVLEAMACGVHVISSKIPSSVEIGSNIFLYFKSEVEIPKLILNLRRKRSKKKLIKRAKKFDWKDVVEKFTQIYDTLSASTI